MMSPPSGVQSWQKRIDPKSLSERIIIQRTTEKDTHQFHQYPYTVQKYPESNFDPIMDISRMEKQKSMVGDFISETIKKTFFSSTSRRVIFFSILALRFLSVPYLSDLSWLQHSDTYFELKEKSTHESSVRFYSFLVEFILLTTLIIKSPKENIRNRIIGKYVVLILSIYLWFVSELVMGAFEEPDTNLITKSYLENRIPVYGKIVFASYMREEKNRAHPKSTLVSYAEKLSPETRGIILIVQMDSASSQFPVMKNKLLDFNKLTDDQENPNNIPTINPDIPNCAEFVLYFSGKLKRFPELPKIDRFVKFMYDPFENGIGLPISTTVNPSLFSYKTFLETSTDSTTLTIPTLDSIPSIKSRHSLPN